MLTIGFDSLWKLFDFIISCSLVSMLLATLTALKEDSDLGIFHLVGNRIHRRLTKRASVPRNLTIDMARSKTERAVITAGFARLRNELSAIEASEGFVDGFHSQGIKR